MVGKKVFKWLFHYVNKENIMKIKYLFKTPTIITSFVLLIIALILIIINKLLFKQVLVDYISGTITEIFGIIITILFVQLIFDKKSTDNKKDEELKKIIRSDKIICLLIERYTSFLHYMTHDYKVVFSINPSLNTDFNISDMKGLHRKSLNENTGRDRSTISLFYESELELRNIFMSLIQNIDFNFFPEISSLLLEYIKVSYQFDARSEILNNERLRSGPDKKNFTLIIEEYLEKSAEKILNEYLEGKMLYRNMLLPYINLYIMLIKQKNILIKYNENIKKYIKENMENTVA